MKLEGGLAFAVAIVIEQVAVTASPGIGFVADSLVG
jgi:hypothetical protein